MTGTYNAHDVARLRIEHLESEMAIPLAELVAQAERRAITEHQHGGPVTWDQIEDLQAQLHDLDARLLAVHRLGATAPRRLTDARSAVYEEFRAAAEAWELDHG